MRFVDIDQLELPDGWQMRADQALNSLRAEIEKAEADARAAGEDPAAARKAAITAGLKITVRVRIWQELNNRLSLLTNGKCWYSESRNPTADKNVDHFRPKNSVNEDPNHEGYWWLAFKWKNYRYASVWCNQRRIDKVNNSKGGKGDHFPLCRESYRAQLEIDNYELEEPKLLDPTDPEDWKLLTFREDGHPIPIKQPGTLEHKRAATSIEMYHLHGNELVRDRRVLAGEIRRLVQVMERLQLQISDRAILGVYKEQQKNLLRKIRQDAEYSAAALAYARAEIYTERSGHQVERKWLKELLDGNT